MILRACFIHLKIFKSFTKKHVKQNLHFMNLMNEIN